jgi:hypothetical protein
MESKSLEGAVSVQGKRMNTAQILSEMAIDVWRLRADSHRQDFIEVAANAEEVGGDAGQIRQEAGLTSPGIQEQTSPAAESTAATLVPGDPGEPAEPGMAESDAGPVPEFNVVSLADEGGLLLFQSADLKSPRRFAVDLLAAATGRWSRDYRQLVFAWPQAGIENTNASMVKALAAFVEKQINDAPSNRVLVTAELFQRLDRSWPAVDIQKIPEIDKLMVDAELKKVVWLEISERWLL